METEKEDCNTREWETINILPQSFDLRDFHVLKPGTWFPKILGNEWLSKQIPPPWHPPSFFVTVFNRFIIVCTDGKLWLMLFTTKKLPLLFYQGVIRAGLYYECRATFLWNTNTGSILPTVCSMMGSRWMKRGRRALLTVALPSAAPQAPQMLVSIHGLICRNRSTAQTESDQCLPVKGPSPLLSIENNDLKYFLKWHNKLGGWF